ncbi:hypothetical protein INT45_010948, partial [Circinella minor]
TSSRHYEQMEVDNNQSGGDLRARVGAEAEAEENTDVTRASVVNNFTIAIGSSDTFMDDDSLSDSEEVSVLNDESSSDLEFTDEASGNDDDSDNETFTIRNKANIIIIESSNGTAASDPINFDLDGAHVCDLSKIEQKSIQLLTILEGGVTREMQREVFKFFNDWLQDEQFGQLATILADPGSRARLERDWKSTDQTILAKNDCASMSDIFDGAAFQEEQKHLFDGPHNIALALFVDSFSPFKRSKISLTIVHFIVLNYHPSEW